MANFSDYFENAIINLMRNTAFSEVATVYVALFTGSAGIEANNPTAEVSGGSYARQTCALDAASGGATANTSRIMFPTATANWGTVTHLAVVDHETNTNWGSDVNVLMWAALDVARTVNTDELLKITAGDLDITVA
tara:strand:- start:147 stop:554 length:408 start_codon:yes stop_codon:yes gene_type:complete